MRNTCAMAIAICLLAAPAFAYLDPGTGSLVLQGIIAALATASVSICLAWRQVKSVVSNLFRRVRGVDRK